MQDESNSVFSDVRRLLVVELFNRALPWKLLSLIKRPTYSIKRTIVYAQLQLVPAVEVAAMVGAVVGGLLVGGFAGWRFAGWRFAGWRFAGWRFGGLEG